MKKIYLPIALILTVLIVVVLAISMKYVKATFSNVENRLSKEFDITGHSMHVPQEALNKNCKYDIDRQTDGFIKAHSEYNDYTWNANTKTGVINLKSGEELTVIRGGCAQYDCYLTLNNNNGLLNFDDKQGVLQQILPHAQKLFDAEDYHFFIGALTDGSYRLEVYDNELSYTFESSHYCLAQIYVRNFKSKNTSLIKIGFSKC